MRRSTATVTALVCLLVARPVVAGAPATDCGAPDRCFAELVRTQQTVASITADFRQVKRVALLREPLVSTGRFLFARPDRVRWEVVSPEAFTIEISAERLRIGEGDGAHDVEAPQVTRAFRDLAAIFTATGDAVRERYVIERGSKGPWSFVLRPRAPDLARQIAGIELELDPATRLPHRVLIREPGGDETEVELSNVRVERKPDSGASR